MSDDDIKTPKPLPFLTEDAWRKWYAELRTGVDDLDAVAEDQLRPVRERDLGVREATRLRRDARDKLARLFAYVDQAGQDDPAAVR